MSFIIANYNCFIITSNKLIIHRIISLLTSIITPRFLFLKLISRRTRMNTGSSPVGNGQLATWVRNWVHYDNLTVDFSRQSSSARKMKDEYETKIIETLKAQKMENAQIQIAGAKLQICQEKSFPTLTIGRLQEYLHSYYKRKGVMLDETEQIMAYIKQQKQNNYELAIKIKKTPTVAPLPPLPPIPPQLK